jgi:septum formation protein
MQQANVYLASLSPRRQKLLSQIGISFELLKVRVDETYRRGETPEQHVIRLALAKAKAGLESLQGRPLLPVLGADTMVVVDQKILGKPRDRDDGLAMLAALSGREHCVLSAVALVAGTRRATRLQKSWVRWRELSPTECQAYWNTGEPLDKAGAYAIQGRAAAFITELKGSYSGVMGLPLFETTELLRDFGIHVL